MNIVATAGRINPNTKLPGKNPFSHPPELTDLLTDAHWASTNS
jgi:hypothetical protein